MSRLGPCRHFSSIEQLDHLITDFFFIPFFFFFSLSSCIFYITDSEHRRVAKIATTVPMTTREKQCACCTNVRICVCGSITHSLSCWSFCDSRLNALCGGGNAENLKCFALNVVGLHPFYHVQSNVVPK